MDREIISASSGDQQTIARIAYIINLESYKKWDEIRAQYDSIKKQINMLWIIPVQRSQLFNVVGEAYAYNENYKDALSFFRKAINYNPAFFNAKINLGLAQNAIPNYDSAKIIFREIIRDSSRINSSLRSYAYCGLAESLNRENKKAPIIDSLKLAYSLVNKAIRYESSNALAYETKGDILTKFAEKVSVDSLERANGCYLKIFLLERDIKKSEEDAVFDKLKTVVGLAYGNDIHNKIINEGREFLKEHKAGLSDVTKTRLDSLYIK